MQYPAPLAITWQRTFRQVAPTAQALLRLVAHLAPDPIPVAMFESGAKILREAAQRLCSEAGEELTLRPLREDIAELTGLSLIARQGGVVTMHPVVQEVIRHRIPEESRAVWIELAMKLVAQHGPDDSYDPYTWPVWDLLRSHTVQVLAHAAEQDTVEGYVVSQLMGRLGSLLAGKGLFREAEPIMRKALKVSKEVFGTNHLETASGLYNLGTLLRTLHRLDEAEPLLRRSIEIFFAPGQERHPDATKPFNTLALLFMDRHQWAEAEEWIRKALALDQESYGEIHPATALDMRFLALLLRSTGRTPEAEPVIRRSVEISQEVNGEAHPLTAKKMLILACILRDLGRTDEAEPLARRTLEIFEQALGPEHPLTQTARKDLSSLTLA